ncbi:MAG: aspartyl protease family protein [Planctomycetota bacterium]
METVGLDEATTRRVDGGAMGQVVVDIQVTNAEDLALLRRKFIKPEEVRVVRSTAIVDTGASMLSLPPDLLDQLGLPVVRQEPATYADGRVEMRDIHAPATLRVLDRTVFVELLAGHAGVPALLGQLPLESLDYHVDPKRQRLIPSPESPDMPMRRM